MIGITGGFNIFELGSAVEVRLFFDCIKTYVVQPHQEEDWSILTDRLYKRYLRLEDLDAASQKMCKVQKIFSKLKSTDSINWSDYKFDEKNGSKINFLGETLEKVFEAYFSSFFDCVEAAKMDFYSYDNHQDAIFRPVKLTITKMPWYIIEKQRPLSDYDNLEGDPFWFVK